MVKWREKWVGAVWEMLGILMFLSGFFSGNVVRMVVGVVMAFGSTSIYLTSYVESEHRVKKALEVVSVFIALLIVVYGYVVTRALVLGVLTFFIVGILFIAFVLSYLLPVIRRKLKSPISKSK